MPPNDLAESPYHVYVSFAPQDTSWVRDEFVPRLRSEGVKVCVEYEFFLPGATRLGETERAMKSSHCTLLVLTPDYLRNPWEEFENQLSVTLSLATGASRVIPLLFKPCAEQNLPLRTKALVSVDFTLNASKERDFQFQRLVATLLGRPLPQWEGIKTETAIDPDVVPLHQVIPNIVELAASRNFVVYKKLLPSVLKVLGIPGACPLFMEALRERPAARRLFSVREVREQLEFLRLSNRTSDEFVAIDRLLNTLPYNWPFPWPVRRSPPTEAVGNALKYLGWRDNPFGPEQAEFDPKLPEFRVEPLSRSDLELLEAPQPSLLRSVPGYGQTATMLALIEHFQSNRVARPGHRNSSDHLFPVLMDDARMLRARQPNQNLVNLSYAVAMSLLDFLAFNPHAFGSTHHNHQRSIARLIAAHQPSLGDVGQYLARAGLWEFTLANSLAQSIVEAGLGTSPMSYDEDDTLQTLQEARLDGFWGYVMLTDISGWRQALLGSAVLSARLQPLFGLVPNLVMANVFVKVAVAGSDDLAADVFPRRLGPPHWNDDPLAEMLRQRLKWACNGDDGSLTGIFGPDRPRDVNLALVQASNGSPQRLVRLGNELLTLFGERGKLTSGDFAEARIQIDPWQADQPSTSYPTGVTSRRKLRQMLCQHFDVEELKTLSNDLGIDYENLPVHGKEAMARELIAKLERLGKLPNLIAQCRQLRPDVIWDLPLTALEPLC